MSFSLLAFKVHQAAGKEATVKQLQSKSHVYSFHCFAKHESDRIDKMDHSETSV